MGSRSKIIQDNIIFDHGYGKITSITASRLKKSVSNKDVFSVESPTAVLDNVITEHMLKGHSGAD